jgi:hypothetical protein
LKYVNISAKVSVKIGIKRDDNKIQIG